MVWIEPAYNKPHIRTCICVGRVSVLPLQTGAFVGNQYGLTRLGTHFHLQDVTTQLLGTLCVEHHDLTPVDTHLLVSIYHGGI